MQRSVKQPAGDSCPGDENQLLGWDYLDVFLFHIRENRLPCSPTTGASGATGLCSFWGLWYQEEQTLASVWAPEHLRTSRPNSLGECPRQGNASMELWWPQQNGTKDASWFLRIRNRICTCRQQGLCQYMPCKRWVQYQLPIVTWIVLDFMIFHVGPPKNRRRSSPIWLIKEERQTKLCQLHLASWGNVQIVFFSKRCKP